MRISTQRDALFAQLQTVTRAASTRSAVQALSGVQILASGARHRAAGDRHGDRPARTARRRGRARGRRRAAGAAAGRRRPLAAGRLGRRSSCAAAEQDVEIVAGAATFHIRTLRLEDFPPFPEPEGDGRVAGAGRGVRRDDRQGRALGVARRDAPGADRHPRVGDGRRAAHGRDRLLPAVGQGDAARVAARGRVRGERAGARAAGAQPDRRPGRGGRAERRGAHEPGRSSRPAASCSPRA